MPDDFDRWQDGPHCRAHVLGCPDALIEHDTREAAKSLRLVEPRPAPTAEPVLSAHERIREATRRRRGRAL